MDTLTHALSGMLVARASYKKTDEMPLWMRSWAGFFIGAGERRTGLCVGKFRVAGDHATIKVSPKSARIGGQHGDTGVRHPGRMDSA